MAKRKSADTENRAPLSAEQRIANVLGLLLVKDLGPTDAILNLDAAGFDTADISQLLNTTQKNIAMAKYQQRKKKKSD